MDNSYMIFLYVIPNWCYIGYFEIFKTDEILTLQRTFSSEGSPDVEYAISIATSFSYILSF